jgi:hypothetical protein
VYVCQCAKRGKENEGSSESDILAYEKKYRKELPRRIKLRTKCGYGVVCGGVHVADEWVDLDSLRIVTHGYVHAIMDYLNNHS